ncbi:hypothetical protein Tco_0377237 [Tanacetum coccineum]
MRSAKPSQRRFLLNYYPITGRGKLIQKLLLNQKYLKSKTTEDIISIGSFMEVIVLNHYVLVRKIISGPKDPVFVKSLADNSEVSITGSNKPKLSKAEDSTLSNNDTGKVPSNESQRNTTGHSVVVSDFSATDYDSANESSVCSTPLPPFEKLTGAEPVYGPKTIKSILKSKSTFKAKTLKGIIIKEPSSTPTRGNKSSSVSKTNSAPAEEETKNCETYDSNVHTTSDHNDIEWFRKREALQAKKAESFKASKT